MYLNKIEPLLHEIVQAKWFNLYTTTLVVCFYLFFLINHLSAFWSGTLSAIIFIFVVMETIVISLLLMRRQPLSRSTSLHAWLFALLGTLSPLAFIPSSTVVQEGLGNALMILGGLVAILSYLSLNTSFGIAPAIRKIKTTGLYHFMRHPMYLSYIVLYTGYNLLSFSAFNLVIYVGMLVLMLGRIHYEEKLLVADPEYIAYTKKVSYRLIPGIY